MIGLATILLLGVGAQWLAWRLRLPSILLLLLCGFAAGPLTGHALLDPDSLLGDALLPLVSLSVGVILLEGGLGLRFRELGGGGGAVRNLVLIGVPVTWGLATLAARGVLDLDWGLSTLLGAILVVTGPTVIIPLLHHVRPSGTVSSVVRWEGIVTDPIGALLAVLVFEALVAGGGNATTFATAGLLKAILAGGVGGGLGAGMLLFVLRRDLVPDSLQSSLALAVGLGVFVAADAMQHESGLLAVTVMGIAIANQRTVSVEHIIEFKENLRVLLISCLFIVLAARLPPEELRAIDLRSVLFVGSLVLVVRPTAVFLSSIGTSLTWRERVFVAWMAPRGIVAAAVASVFAMGLAERGHPGADRIISVVFTVIVVTVALYGLTAGPLARRLGLAGGDPQGVLIVGAHAWARELGVALRDAGLAVLFVDTNHRFVQQARLEGLAAHYGNVLTEEFPRRAPLDGIGYLFCLTPNEEVNSLACLELTPLFGRAHVYQLAPVSFANGEGEDDIPRHLRGKILFGERADYWTLRARHRAGGTVKRTRLSEEFALRDFLAHHSRRETPAIPLCAVSAEGRLHVFTAHEEARAGEGDTLIALVPPPREEPPPSDEPS